MCIVQYPAARRQEHPSAVQNTVHGSLNIDTSILCSRAYRERFSYGSSRFVLVKPANEALRKK